MMSPSEVSLDHCVSNAFSEIQPFVLDGTVCRVVLLEGEPAVCHYIKKGLQTLLGDTPLVSVESSHEYQPEPGDYRLSLTPEGLKSLQRQPFDVARYCHLQEID